MCVCVFYISSLCLGLYDGDAGVILNWRSEICLSFKVVFTGERNEEIQSRGEGKCADICVECVCLCAASLCICPQ
ncbi:hypothetical protein, unlikely [Trypanosoma brucei gambiense DAL972]|uniref:T. brucei spp.-specific protein n=1 Tax=Trypanosoma brucei gambiense (strain MHOM/CI/86/DAL972) TaxID=679716 RepID=C9ZI79_TRYB9|nr:hypothetical protein, unlikely [Trypanosoma brucei gambiense DAL972]CBH08871.1 hypothetical protein, unlikely [Trypanosoma brucei gambiense DAL972]|eukprot:XP_011771312.1 hypothetical protein, unlikely [Trypanosoma brucei gambiense DAL972]